MYEQPFSSHACKKCFAQSLQLEIAFAADPHPSIHPNILHTKEGSSYYFFDDWLKRNFFNKNCFFADLIYFQLFGQDGCN